MLSAICADAASNEQSLLGDYGIILPFVGAILSIPFFVIILTQPAYAPAARFLLLTYNLTCLYAFNLRGGEDDELNVFEIAWHRTIVRLLDLIERL